MYLPRYGLFYDFHTDIQAPHVGASLDPAWFAQEVAACGVDFLTLHARCNQGFCYYPSAFGIPHPALKQDLFGNLCRACTERGIHVSAYLNGGLSNEEAIRHPDWMMISKDGRIYGDMTSPFVRSMCFNSPYREHLKDMVREIASRYPVVGFFIDCFGFSHSCNCPRCMADMARRGVDVDDPQARYDYAKVLSREVARELVETAREFVDDPLFYFNGLGYEEQEDISPYMEYECLPTSPTWGYDNLPLVGRHVRTLNYPVVMNMTGRFRDWGDFGSLRPQAAMESDLLLGLSLGLRPNIGSHLHPDGRWEQAVFDRLKQVYGTLRRFEPYLDHTVKQAECAVLFTKDTYYFSAKSDMRGVAKLLSELQIQFDVITPKETLDGYKLIILMSGCKVNQETERRLRDHVARGGRILTVSDAGLNTARTAYVLEDLLGVRYGAPQPLPAYFLAAPSFAPSLADMPRAQVDPGVNLEPLPETETVAWRIDPVTQAGWDGVHVHFYLPPEIETHSPAVTFHGPCCCCAFDLFGAYYKTGSEEFRNLASAILERLLPQRLLRLSQTTSHLHAIAAKRDNQEELLVYLHCYDHEEEAYAGPAELRVHTSQGKVSRVTSATHGELPFSVIGEETIVQLPSMHGFDAVSLRGNA